MRIAEINGNIAKIEYTSGTFAVFDFVFIADEEFSLAGQVLKSSFDPQNKIGELSVRICFMTDNNDGGNIVPYNGFCPSENAVLSKLQTEQIVDLLKSSDDEGIFWGKSLNDFSPAVTEKSLISDKLCVVSDKPVPGLCANLFTSLVKTEMNPFVLDFTGSYRTLECENKRTVGKDFAIPLNVCAFNFFVENEIEECDTPTKAVLIEIINELKLYVASLPEKFIPFDTFKSVIDERFSQEPSPGLMYFASKLNEYAINKVFANDESEFAFVNESTVGYLDVSGVDARLHKAVLNSVVEQISSPRTVIADISEYCSDFDTIKNIYQNENITFLPIVTYFNKNRSNVEFYCKSRVLFKPSDDSEIPDDLSKMFEKLGSDDCILTGDNLMSFVFGISTAPEVPVKKAFATPNPANEELDDIDLYIGNRNPKDFIIEDPEETTEPQDSEPSDRVENLETPEVTEADEPISLAEEPRKIEPSAPSVEMPEPAKQPDLVIPDDFNSKIPARAGFGKREPAKDDVPAPQTQPAKALNADLPIYETKQPENTSDYYVPGSRVVHAKYGVGTIEKVIAYGKKTLCSIQFENVGRRLLDPNVTKLDRI